MGDAIEVGVGDVWSFTAAENITSGLVVWLSGNAKVGIATASGKNPIGVSLTPASAGKPCAVLMRGIVEIETTGVGNAVAGDRFTAGAGGKAMKDNTVSGKYELGFAIENITRNSKGKIYVTI